MARFSGSVAFVWARNIVAIAVSGAGLFGCSMALSDGAAKVYEKGFFCPADRVIVTPRPDVPVHTIVGHAADGSVARPPPEIAADPGRMALWQAQVSAKWAEVDRLGPPYQVDGCGKTALLVCYHPTTLDIATGGGVTVGGGGMSISTSGGPAVLMGYVQCQSGQPPNSGKLGLATDNTTVAEVRDGSAAALAGLQRGDVILAVDRQPVATGAQLIASLRVENPAGHVLTVRRGNGMIELVVRP